MRKKPNFVGKFPLMAVDNKTLERFTTRIRQMILQYGIVREENERLHERVGEQENEIKRLRESLEQANREGEAIKLAKMLEISDRDVDAAKRRVASLIRDVNKCITLLSEGEQ